MSRLQSALRAYPAGTLMTPAMMRDHKEMQRLIDNDPTYYEREGCFDKGGKPWTGN